MVAHEIKEKIEQIWYVPDHDKRHETGEYKHNHEVLVAKYGCYICGSKDDLETHHYGCEWSEWNYCNPDKLKEFLLLFDVYGLSHSMESKAIESVDDIRNLMVLCSKHHRHRRYGIHGLTFPIWIMQKIKQDGDKIIGN